eukprot:scaffold2639_cov385-Prasinococcus_capsulatus_cf.AAC.4
MQSLDSRTQQRPNTQRNAGVWGVPMNLSGGKPPSAAISSTLDTGPRTSTAVGTKGSAAQCAAPASSYAASAGLPRDMHPCASTTMCGGCGCWASWRRAAACLCHTPAAGYGPKRTAGSFHMRQLGGHTVPRGRASGIHTCTRAAPACAQARPSQGLRAPPQRTRFSLGVGLC